MSNHHLSVFEQEEYVIGERTAGMLRHLALCAQCRASVTRLEESLTVFRSAAVAYSDASLSSRPQPLSLAAKARPMVALRWAMAGVLPIILLVLALLAFRSPDQRPVRPVAAISDDALLDQVDDQLSVAVPSSMESLTHLVSTEKDQPAGGKQRVQPN